MKDNNRLLAAMVVGSFALIVIFHLASAAAGYPQFRDIHLGTALEYATAKIDILRPVIVGFNATNTPTPQELPLWQAATAIVFKLVGTWYGWANVVSLILFGTSIWPLYKLASKYLGRRAGYWTLLFFLFQPIVFIFAGMAATDGLALASMVWFLFLADHLLSSGNLKWFLPAVTFAILTAVSKLPFFMAAGLGLFFLTLTMEVRNLRRWAFLGALSVITTLVFAAWSRYLDHVYSLAIFPEVDLRLIKGSTMWFWYFGDWHWRLNAFNWGKGGWTALNSLFGSFALVGLAGWSLFFSKNRLGQTLFFGAVATTLVFSHLVLAHRHYYLMFSPAVALLCADAASKLEGLLTSNNFLRRPTTTLLAAVVLVLSTVQGLIGIKIILGYDSYPEKIVRLLQEQTSSQDKILIQGGGWGGEMLFRSDRKGLSLITTLLLEDPAAVRKLKELGFSKLVMINESPLLTALKKVDPGNTKLERMTYDQFITDTPRAWPTLFQNEDMLVKMVP